jgi:hypothetical protein
MDHSLEIAVVNGRPDLKSTTRNGHVQLKWIHRFGGTIPVSCQIENDGFLSLWWMFLNHQAQLWISRCTCYMADCNYRMKTFRWYDSRGLSSVPTWIYPDMCPVWIYPDGPLLPVQNMSL